MRIIGIGAAMFGVATTAMAQGNFVNLGFEAANLPTLPPGQSELAPVSQAVPGWTVRQNSELVASILHNGLTLGSPALSILGPSYEPVFGLPKGIIEGQFTVALVGSSILGAPTDISIEQAGLFPANSRSVQFKAFGDLSVLNVSVNGGSLSLVPLMTSTNYTLFGADISVFAGQSADLRFTSVAPQSGAAGFYLDSIAFSTTPVPESATWALFGVGSALFWCAARRRWK